MFLAVKISIKRKLLNVYPNKKGIPDPLDPPAVDLGQCIDYLSKNY